MTKTTKTTKTKKSQPNDTEPKTETGTKTKDPPFKKVWSNVLTSILTVVILTTVGVVEKLNIIKIFGGNTQEDMDNMKMPSSVDQVENIENGQYIRYEDIDENTSINWSKDEDLLLNMDLKADREIFKRTVRLRYKSALDIYITAGARYDSRESKRNFGMVMTRIMIDGKQCSKDTAFLSTQAVCPLYSSASCTVPLTPGEYNIVVEGIFSGCVENHGASVKLKVTRIQEITYGEYKKLKAEGYQPIGNKLNNADNQGNTKPVVRSLHSGFEDPSDRTDAAIK
ncbi:MAG: hypothetical protein GY940_37960 [bacterium]|nr:hypothetical protein [bacterium]